MLRKSVVESAADSAMELLINPEFSGLIVTDLVIRLHRRKMPSSLLPIVFSPSPTTSLTGDPVSMQFSGGIVAFMASLVLFFSSRCRFQMSFGRFGERREKRRCDLACAFEVESTKSLRRSMQIRNDRLSLFLFGGGKAGDDLRLSLSKPEYNLFH